ncbi:pro-epidermal growth factor [Megalops cyprinoides]|uniref:pro-epidermal growth factor n=1 Tax=Megalops cyprinoides TaxID=118141 RepID=UPI001863F247|nr:pro-epidermal growth factor [Megalops cyprinoides]
MLLAVFVVALLDLVAVSAEAACWRGHWSAAGGRSCMAPEPYLLFSHDQAIYQINADGENQSRIVAGTGTSVLLDFHYTDSRLYWANTESGLIQTSLLNGTQRQSLHLADKGITGFAFDWVHDHVVWTNGVKGTMERVGSNGKNAKIISANLSQPGSIAIDPNHRFIFWVSDGTMPSIQQSTLEGEMTSTILRTSLRLGTLSLDISDRRLFWIQFGLEHSGTIGSCDYNGNVINIINQPPQSQPLGMSVFLEYVYYTDMKTRTIKSVDKYTGDQLATIIPKHPLQPPANIKVVHPLQQPVLEAPSPILPDGGCDSMAGDCVAVCFGATGTGVCQCREGFVLSTHGNHCEDVNECAHWNHGCTLGCENIPGSYFCTCPPGFVLLPDMKTCHELSVCTENTTLCDHRCVHTEEGDICICPEGSMLQPDGHTCTGCLSWHNGGCSQLCVPLGPTWWECHCLPGYEIHPDGKRCMAIGPAPYLLLANVVDIQHMNMDGTGEFTVLKEPRGTVVALDYDPVELKVYFANKALKHLERANLDGSDREVLVIEAVDVPEGLAVDWINRMLYWTDRGHSTIERSDLNGLNRESIIRHSLQKPRGIAIHPVAQKLFWTDLGERPAVESATLDGGNRVAIATAGLVAPTGVAIDYTEDQLYWCDSVRGTIEMARLDGSDRRTLTGNEVGHPFDIVIFEDLVWITDWDHNLILKVDKRTGQNPSRLYVNTVRPASVVVVHPIAKPGADVCLYKNGGCDQICESTFGVAHCSCHLDFIESGDGKTCSSVNTTTATIESGDSQGPEPFRLKKKTLNDEGVPLGLANRPLSAQEEEEFEPTLVTEKMVSDQVDCYSLQCDKHAQCLSDGNSATCQCLEGYAGDGMLCEDIDECAMGVALCSSRHADCQNTDGGYLCQCQAGFSGDSLHCSDIDECTLGLHNCDNTGKCVNTEGAYQCKCDAGFRWTGFTCQAEVMASTPTGTRDPHHVTTQWQSNNVIESCPSSHDTYCLYDGSCFYFPEIQSYGCKQVPLCAPGYMGERCQFSDLEWRELQQAEKEKRLKLTIAACMVGLVSLLSLAACLTYCYGSVLRSRMFSPKHHPTDDVSDTSTSEDSTIETTITSSPRFYMVLEHGSGSDGKVIHVVGCQRRQMCPSCSSETGESVVSEDVCMLESPFSRGSDGGPTGLLFI